MGCRREGIEADATGFFEAPALRPSHGGVILGDEAAALARLLGACCSL